MHPVGNELFLAGTPVHRDDSIGIAVKYQIATGEVRKALNGGVQSRTNYRQARLQSQPIILGSGD